MTDIRRRIALTFAGGGALLLVYALAYRWAMATFEGEELSYLRSAQVVLEALTTAGFGGDAPWSSPETNMLVIAMNLTGVLLVFFAIPFFVVPLLEGALQTDPPTETDLSDHVIVCADSPRETAFRAELEKMGIPELFIKRDADLVTELVRDGVGALYGDPETARTLEDANVSEAQAIIVDVNDEVNANIILTARRCNPDIRVLSVVEDGDTEAYHEYAGADEVVRPRVAVGERLAMKARGAQFRDDASKSDRDQLPLTEVVIERESDLAGRTLSECRFRERFGLTVLGGWFHGEFVAPVDPDRQLLEHTVLLVVGKTEMLPTLEGRTAMQTPCNRVIVAGYGVVGRTVAETLSEDDVDVTVVDTEDKPGVDIVGNVTDPATLQKANAAEADSIVLALSRDSLVVFAGLVIGDHAPNVETLARADDVNYVQKAYDAGVEYTLALSEVTAHMATRRLFGSPDHGSATDTFEIVRTRVPEFHGWTLGDIDVRSETGVHVAAVERDGTLTSSPEPTFEFRRTDTLVIAGRATDVGDFERLYVDDDS
jgi:Trk K+ transport system NAD-binding subunit